ncbi:oocyte zinc finger protein XlCOF6-like [Battus philenor]|uniref:oocyte zinc finger protein XlCOF6-like n=1 Tax=Battus philenor TaxID=42288 RepID=UPI0035D09498
MDTVKVCRCCLTEGFHKDLNTSSCLDKKETFSDMLLECFNIELTIDRTCNVICDVCIGSLRSSLCFKRQVIKAELDFINWIKEKHENDQTMMVKDEPKENSDGEESDNYLLCDTGDKSMDVKVEPKRENDRKDTCFLSDVVKETSHNITNPRQVLKRRMRSSKKQTEGAKWRTEKIKTLVSRLASSITSCEISDLKLDKEIHISKGKRKITISQSEPKINLVWSSKANTDKAKHKENLQTILEHSNATPFKNKSLLGYICGYCDETFPDPIDLRTHTEEKHRRERLHFKSNFDMTEYNVKLDITDLVCSLCGKSMDNLTVLKDHLVKTHNQVIHNDIKDHIQQFKLKKGDVYNCAMCTSTYETFKMLKQHMNKHYSNYTCVKCHASFVTKRSLNAHETTHQEGSFKCDQCDKVFSSRAKKQYHEKTKHLGERNISNCPYCDQPFRSYYQRNQHLVKVHNSEAQYKCNVCSKAYILKSLLMYHIKKSHLMERNCQCNECGFRFFSKKALKAHMVKHTGKRIFACEVCHKAYARKYTLREHMRIHSNDRRFKCDVCSVTFVQKCSLKSHLLSNHGISMAASAITST